MAKDINTVLTQASVTLENALEEIERLQHERDEAILGVDKAQDALNSANKRLVAIEKKITQRAKSLIFTKSYKRSKKTLLDYIREIFRQNKNRPMDIKEIASLALEKGYSTKAKRFEWSVSSLLSGSHEFSRVSRGVYKPA